MRHTFHRFSTHFGGVFHSGRFRGYAQLRIAAGTSQSPTLTKGTAHGVVLGTASYMSPEQARGKPVDKRTDIWAFGCCLYEALTGKKAFDGQTVTDVLVAVVKSEPAWDALPPETTWRLRELLSWCLRKEQRRRLREISVAGVYLEAALDEPTRHVVQEAAPRSASAWSVVVVTAIAASLVTWMATNTARAPRSVNKVRVGLQPGRTLGVSYQGEGSSTSPLSRTAMVFLPDGRSLIFSSENEEQGQLYLRRLDERDASPIAGTGGAIGPFLSPDGDWVGFWADGKLRKVPIEGGVARELCDLPYPPLGVSWGRDATIVFGQRAGPILRISAGGGLPEPVTTLQDEFNHLLPSFLPDGKNIFFTSRSNQLGHINSWEGTNLMLQSLENGERKLLMEDAADGRFAPTGHVAFVRMDGRAIRSEPR